MGRGLEFMEEDLPEEGPGDVVHPEVEQRESLLGIRGLVEQPFEEETLGGHRGNFGHEEAVVGVVVGVVGV